MQPLSLEPCNLYLIYTITVLIMRLYQCILLLQFGFATENKLYIQFKKTHLFLKAHLAFLHVNLEPG